MNNLSPKALEYFLLQIKIKLDRSEYSGLSEAQFDNLKVKAAISKLETKCGLF